MGALCFVALPPAVPRVAFLPVAFAVSLAVAADVPLDTLAPPSPPVVFLLLVLVLLEEELLGASGAGNNHWSPWIHLNASSALLGQVEVQPAAELAGDVLFAALRSKQDFLSNRCVFRQHGTAVSAALSDDRTWITKQQPMALSPLEVPASSAAVDECTSPS
mmetsp:Transcript_58866/g.117783  ORF Transcript_58866/g.117783 Transcript_58866/m.117783 type:complete len:162 (+) Transcript_58866:638-1123(+)